ncbi:hypothetical protein BDZ97DRAFT_1761747 [Flammula alnicola]|nr:hypothetical protein BDZ97DRAFT_1761747 [Flammula alnicola]
MEKSKLVYVLNRDAAANFVDLHRRYVGFQFQQAQPTTFIDIGLQNGVLLRTVLGHEASLEELCSERLIGVAGSVLRNEVEPRFIPLLHPLKSVTHPANPYFYIIEAGHRVLGEDATNKRLEDLRQKGEKPYQEVLNLPAAVFGRPKAAAGRNEAAFSLAIVPFAARNGELHLVVGKALRIYNVGMKRLLHKVENKLKVHALLLDSDMQESVQFAVYKHMQNRLLTFADDTQPRWVSAMTMVDYNTVAVGDQFGNIFVNRPSVPRFWWPRCAIVHWLTWNDRAPGTACIQGRHLDFISALEQHVRSEKGNVLVWTVIYARPMREYYFKSIAGDLDRTIGEVLKKLEQLGVTASGFYVKNVEFKINFDSSRERACPKDHVYSYTSRSDAQRFSSDGEDSAQNMRRLVVSPSPSQEHDNVDDDYSDDNSLDEVDATLNNLDDELDDTEHALTEWSHSSSYSPGPTFSSATGTFTYSGTYTGSPSFVSLPAFSPRSPPIQPIDPRARLSRITERTEESRPTSTAFSTTNVTRPANPTPDTLRRSALLGGGTPSHSRSSTDPSSDRTLPPPGRLSELRAVFEAQSPSGGHSRAASTPGYRPSSPMFGTGQSITTGYGPGSRPSSPSKSGTGSSGSYSASDMRSSLLSPPPPRPTHPAVFVLRRLADRAHTQVHPIPLLQAHIRGSYTTPGTDSKTYTDSETLTRTSVTPNSGLRRPQTSPRSPLASVRNIVALWKERTPASARPGEKSAPGSVSSVSHLMRQRPKTTVSMAFAAESKALVPGSVTPTRPVSQDVPDNASIRSGRSGVFPPGFDMNEIVTMHKVRSPRFILAFCGISTSMHHLRTVGKDARHCCGGRGIVALDLLNCTSVQLAAESLLERQKWVNRLWEAVNRPIAVPDSASVTRSPTGSIRTILSINSSSSNSSNGSRSTVFVPPLSSLPDISDFISTTSGLSRQSSLVSSHHSRTVDDTVIQNQEYVYPGDSRVITPNRGHSLRRTGSMTDLDEEFKSALNRARGAGGLFGGSPVTISSGSSLGKNIFVTPPPSVGRGSDRARSELSDENFFSAGSSGGLRSNVSSTYFSQTSLTSAGDLRTTTGLTSITGGITTATSETQVAPSTLTSTYRLSDSGSYRSEDSDVSFADSPSTLSRAREIRRRSSQSDRDNEGSEDGTRTPTGSYTPGSAGSSLSGSHSRSGSSLEGRSRTPTGSYTEAIAEWKLQEWQPDRKRELHRRYTPGSGSYTLQGESNIVDSISSSGVGGHTPISSSETGYDICPSSDLTDLTRPTTTSESETATPFSRGSDTLSEVASEKFVTASQGSPEYATAVVQSSRASITSFESFPSIPGSEEYATAESASTEYRTASEPGMETDFVTASEPSEPSPESAYITADMFGSEVGDIPSEVSTPVLSSLRLGSERDVEERSVVVVPSVVPSIRSPSILSELLPEEIPLPPPSVVPSIRSPSLLSELLPEEIPLPPPSVVPSVRSPSILSELLPEEIPLPLSAPSSAPPPPSRALPVPSPSPSPSLSISPIPTPIESSLEEQDVPTPTSFHMPLPTESSRPDEEESIDEEIVSLSLLSSLPPSTLGSTSVVTPTSIAMLSPSTASTLPPSTPVTPQPTVQSSWVTESSISTSGDLSTFTQTSSSFVPPSPRPWASVTDNSYESSILQSPSTHSIALLEGIETSFETSIFRPTVDACTSSAIINIISDRCSDAHKPYVQLGIIKLSWKDTFNIFDLVLCVSIIVELSLRNRSRSRSQSRSRFQNHPQSLPAQYSSAVITNSNSYTSNQYWLYARGFPCCQHYNTTGKRSNGAIKFTHHPINKHRYTERSSVGGSSIISSLHPAGPRMIDMVIPDHPASLSRSTSNASSVASYLSSHYSDDDILEGRDESFPSSQFWVLTNCPPSHHQVRMKVVRRLFRLAHYRRQVLVRKNCKAQAPDVLEQSLRAIQDQLRALEDGQTSARDLLNALQSREVPQPEDHTAELADRLQRIENLVQALVDQRHPRGPEIQILGELASPLDGPHMPIPVTAQTGPSMVQQLDDILSSSNLPSTGVSEPPGGPFVYQPAERGERAPEEPPMHTMRDQAPGQRFHGPPGPTPDRFLRPPTAPASLGQDDTRQGPSWYLPSRRDTTRVQRPSVTTANIPPASTGPSPSAPGAQQQPQRVYMPMPAGPTVLQLPPLFDSLMEILRENRLAQLATVDQQRELMRYMRGLNEWLERDVHDRQSEIRGVVARVEQLSHDLRGMQMRGRRPASRSSGSSDGSETEIIHYPAQGPQMPQPFTGLPPTFQPFATQDNRPVIPPVIPDHRTPPPSFPPVIPTMPPNQPSLCILEDSLIYLAVAQARLAPNVPYTYRQGFQIWEPMLNIFLPALLAPEVRVLRGREAQAGGDTAAQAGAVVGLVVGSVAAEVDEVVAARAVEGDLLSYAGQFPPQPQQQQPTIIIQQPGQQQPQQPIIVPSSPGVMMSDAGMMPPGSMGVPMGGMPMGGMPMTGVGVPMTGMPMTPLPPGVPGSYYPPAPMILQQPSRSSSRSRSRSSSRRRHRRSRTPPAQPQPAPTAPVIITDTRRSRSRSPRHTPQPQMPAGVTVLPSQPFGATCCSPSTRNAWIWDATSRDHSNVSFTFTFTLTASRWTDCHSSRWSADLASLKIKISTLPSTFAFTFSAPSSIIISTLSLSPSLTLQNPSSQLWISTHSSTYYDCHSRAANGTAHGIALRDIVILAILVDRVVMTDAVDLQQDIVHDAVVLSHQEIGVEIVRRLILDVIVQGAIILLVTDHTLRFVDQQIPEIILGAALGRKLGVFRLSPLVDILPAIRAAVDQDHPLVLGALERKQGVFRLYPLADILLATRATVEQDHPLVLVLQHGVMKRSQTMAVLPFLSVDHVVKDHPLERQRGEDQVPPGDRPGTPETLRITVPPRRTDAHRPPTVMTIDDTPGIPGVSRTGTARRPSGGEYTNVHSIYGEPRDSRDRRPRSPESIPDIAVVPSEHDHQTVPSHVPSHVEGLPHLPSSREPTYGEESVPARPASAQRVGDAPRSDTGPPPVHRLPTEASERPAAAQPPPRQATATPFNFHVADESRGQLEELNAAANRLYMTAAAAQEAEDQRELEFRNHEEHREEIFLQNEERRTHEARDRAAGIWDELESRLSALPAPPAPGEVPGEVPVPGEPAQAGDSESIATIRTIATQAATQHASDVLETVREEREAAEREREQAAEERSMLLAELKAEKDRIVEEKDARIRALEDELAQLRGEFEAEKQQRVTEEAEIRERERQEVAERDEYVRAQLGDLTNLVQDQRDMLESKKALMDSRYEETQAHRAEKEMRSIELHDMVQNIYDGMEADRERSQQDRRDSKEALEKIIEDLQRQNAEQRELLQSLSESWRADCEKHHLETIEAVRSTANEQVPFNVQGYLDEFSRALATEVRMLLGEVGKIREERRALQHEIGDLLCMKAKYGPGGEYEPDWKPPGPPPGPPPPDMPPMPDIADVQPPVKPAWRSVHPRPKKKKKAEAQAQAQVRPAASTSAAPMHVAPPSGYDLRQQLTGSWATWQHFYSWGGLATTNAILHSVLVHHGYLSPLRATNSQFQSRGRSLMSVLQRNPLKKLAQNWRYPAVSSPSSSSVPPPPIALNELPLQTTYNDLLPSIRTHVFYHLRSCLWITYDCAIPSDRPFITPYTSTITPSSSYLSDPLNVYACLGMPKPFVHFLGLPLNGAVDSRIVDNYGRFLREGEEEEEKDEDDGQTLGFGVFAMRDLQAGEETVLGWEWDEGNVVHCLPALLNTPAMFPTKVRLQDEHGHVHINHFNGMMGPPPVPLNRSRSPGEVVRSRKGKERAVEGDEDVEIGGGNHEREALSERLEIIWLIGTTNPLRYLNVGKSASLFQVLGWRILGC